MDVKKRLQGVLNFCGGEEGRGGEGREGKGREGKGRADCAKTDVGLGNVMSLQGPHHSSLGPQAWSSSLLSGTQEF